MATLLPIFLDLTQQKVLLVGGGRAALEKLEKLIPTSASIEVIALHLHAETRTLLAQHGIPWQERAFREEDAAGRFLVISAVNNPGTHARIAAAARRQRSLINAVDAPQSSDFYFGAQIQRGALQLAISTHGLFPGVARALRFWLEDVFPEELTGEFNDLVQLRKRAQERLPDPTERMQALKLQLQLWLHQTHLRGSGS